MKTLQAFAAAVMIVCAARAAEMKIDWAAALQVTNGMSSARLVEVMGSKPAQKVDSSAAYGAQLWMWSNHDRKNPESVSFAIFEDRVVQTPARVSKDLSREKIEAIAEERNAELKKTVDAIKADEHEREFRKRETAIFAQKYPNLDPALRAKMESGEVELTNGVRLYFEARKKAKAEILQAAYERKKKYLTEHITELKPAVAKAFVEGRAAVGMTEEQLQMALIFPPDEKNKSADESGEREVLTWESEALRVTLKDGVVTSWEQTQKVRK